MLFSNRAYYGNWQQVDFELGRQNNKKEGTKDNADLYGTEKLGRELVGWSGFHFGDRQCCIAWPVGSGCG